jgi:hypothetical protein
MKNPKRAQHGRKVSLRVPHLSLEDYIEHEKHHLTSNYLWYNNSYQEMAADAWHVLVHRCPPAL